jgi:hypothetical protein
MNTEQTRIFILPDEGIGSTLEHLKLHFDIGIRGQHHDRELGVRRISSELLYELQSADTGHMYITDDYVYAFRPLPQKRKRFCAVLRVSCLELMASKEAFEYFRKSRIIVDQQYG